MVNITKAKIVDISFQLMCSSLRSTSSYSILLQKENKIKCKVFDIKIKK